MHVKILCPNPECGASYSVVDEELGRLDRCQKCGTRFPMVPLTRGDAPSPSETEIEEAPKSAEPELPSPFGQYEIIRMLGRGGMGAVYLAQDTRLERRVALKIPHPEFAQVRSIRERFLREARAAARFHHPNFCPIHEIGEFNGLPYLTMAYIEGGTLSSKLERGRPWDQRKAAEVVRTLAVALAEAHREGIVHRDLKPDNVMFDARGGLVIMDFGLARRFEVDDATLTAAGAVMGTPGYMSPEQAEAQSDKIGPRSDVYSLGVILYELISGRRPFEGSTVRVLAMILTAPPLPPSSYHPEVNPVLESICLKAMAREIDDRYGSMDDFAGALDGFLKAPSAPAPDEESPGRVALALPSHGSRQGKPYPTRSPVRSWLVAVAVVIIAVGVIIYLATDRSRIKIDETAPSDQPIDSAPPVSIVEAPAPPPTVPEKAVARSESPAIIPPRPDDPLITNSIGMKLRLIPAGEVLMGSDESDPDAEDDEKVAGKKHLVRITRPFYLGTTEVTVGQFRRFVESARYKTEAESDGKGGFGWDEHAGTFKQAPKYNWRSPGFTQTDDHPVVNVSWNDATAFCGWLGQQEGQIYRLPTEAEWEYSCRAGQATRFWSGNDPETLATVGNVADGTAKGKYPKWTYSITAKDGFVYAAPVGRVRSRPNAFGLFDMHGNVWEWCADWYDPDYYAKSPPADPLNSSPGAYRVYRGGSWYYFPSDCRSANRSRSAPGNRTNILGFRVARVLSGS
jgi:formylglycine-generating enzyme required for sulfatase activity